MTQHQDLYRRYGLPASPEDVCVQYCTEHRHICSLARDHDGPHMCDVHDEYRYRVARVERRIEARLQAAIEITPDID